MLLLWFRKYTLNSTVARERCSFVLLPLDARLEEHLSILEAKTLRNIFRRKIGLHRGLGGIKI